MNSDRREAPSRLTRTAVGLARHGRQFTAAVLVTAAVIGVSVGIAAPETSPVAPTSTTATVVAVQAPTTTDPRTLGLGRGADGHGRGGRR